MSRLLLVFVLLVMARTGMALTYTVEMTEAQLQSRMSEMIPLVKKNPFVTVTLSSPDVDLAVGNNEIGILSNIAVAAVGGISGSGRVKFVGSISYDAEAGAI